MGRAGDVSFPTLRTKHPQAIHTQGMKHPQELLPLMLKRLSCSGCVNGVIPPWTPSWIRWLFNLRTGKQGGAPWRYEVTDAFEGELLYSHPIGRLSQGQRQLPRAISSSSSSANMLLTSSAA